MSVKDGNERRFNDRLEALRGVAAFWVAVGHSLIWLTIGTEGAIWAKSVLDVHGIQATVARLVITAFNGAAAVDIFFVLSGFVLCRSLADSRLSVPAYLGFVVKRLFRIIPAFWLSLAVVCVYIALIFPGYAVIPGASGWFNNWYTEPLSAHQVVDNATMQSPLLNPNTWTLSIELLASLALPVVALVIGTLGVTGSVALLLVTFLMAWKHESSPASLVHFLYMFVVGAFISMNAQAHYARKFSRVLVPASLALILTANAFFPLVHSFPADILVAIGSALLIWCIDAGSDHPLLAILDSRAAQFLGRISYSFYLLHFIVLYAVANLLLHHTPQSWTSRWPLPIMAVACVISISLALPLSAFSFRYVEKPLTLLGRKLASRQWPQVRAR